MPDAALLVPWLATGVALFLAWFGWGRELSAGRSLLVLLLFGLFPGAVYTFALFPTSLALAFAMGAILAAARERFLIAALAMTAAGLCYPSAWCAPIGLAIGIVLVAVPLERPTLVRRSLWGLAMLGWLPALGLIDQAAFGQPTAYFLMQDEGSTFSLGHLFFQLVINRDTQQQREMGAGGPVLTAQALIAIGLVGAALLSAARAWRTGAERARELYPALAGVLVIVGVVLSGNSGPTYRGVVLAAPCVVCLRRMNLIALASITVAVAITTAVISHYFFNDVLV